MTLTIYKEIKSFALYLIFDVFCIKCISSVVLGAGEASADVPGDGGEAVENLANNVNDLEINGNEDETGNTEEGRNTDAKKKRKKRARGKGVKQTDLPTEIQQTNPPSVPISELFPDGKLIWLLNLLLSPLPYQI